VFTLERNLTAAQFVTNLFHEKAAFRAIWEFTLERNLTAAQFVTNHFHEKAAFRTM
jgi:hypothetical protein